MSRQGWRRPIVFLSQQCGVALRAIDKARYAREGQALTIDTVGCAR